MESKKSLVYCLVAPLLTALSLAGCGGEQPVIGSTTPIVYQGQVYYPSGTQPSSSTDCCCCCDDTTTEDDATVTPAASGSPDPAKTPVPTASKTPEPAKTAAPVDEKDKGRKILDKVLATITTPNAFEVEVDKWEKGLKDGRIVTQTMKVDDEKPGKVKVDILNHSKASSIGAKLFFNTGTGKATVRPGGALSFITKEMDQTDTNLITPNGFTPEQIDFFFLSKRLANTAYKAELIGKTTVNGSETYILKVTRDGTNDLNPDIKYELLGFDLKTFEVRSWELYSANSNDAFMRIIVKSFKVLTDIPDSTFKV